MDPFQVGAVTNLNFTGTLGAFKCSANFLKRALTDRLANYPKVGVSHQALGDHGKSAPIPRSEGCAPGGNRESQEVVPSC